MINYNLVRRIATHIENIIMKPFYFIERKVENSNKIMPFSRVWNLAHTPARVYLWVHFHIVRRDLLKEHLEQQARFKATFANLLD